MARNSELIRQWEILREIDAYGRELESFGAGAGAKRI